MAASSSSETGRFTVVKPDEEVLEMRDLSASEVDTDSQDNTQVKTVQQEIKADPDIPKAKGSATSIQVGEDNGEGRVDETDPLNSLYQEDISKKGKMSKHLRNIQESPNTSPNQKQPDGKESKDETKKNGLGTMFGVFLPTVQNIFGVLIFIRVTWLVGNAGSIEGPLILFLCCCSTTLTSISMSAIATNGKVPAGGSYFMISRALGPEFGGAVGILFYLGFTVAGSMYIIGAIEILVTFIVPQMSVFGDVSVLGNALNNYRLYGTVLVVIIFFICFIGVRFVAKFGPFSLACVVISIICIYIGIFMASPERSIKVCFLGERLLTLASVSRDGVMMCTKNETGPIFQNYCGMGPDNETVCDPYFLTHNTSLKAGYPGLFSGNFLKNTANRYTKAKNLIGGTEPGDRSRGEIVADLTTSFTVLMAIYFPSVTGIMTGSNMSGDLKDAQKSIPSGTIGAVLITSFIYCTLAVCFAAGIDGDLLRDKLGESLGGGLVIAYVAWPTKWVVLVGSFLSTIGAGLQSINGAPRLLYAIAKDEIVPFLGVFARTRRGEPFNALLLTAIIAEAGVLVGNLDFVTPLITMYFLTCYLFVNVACAVQTILRAPSWRPRFRFYHWSLSLTGACLCITLMVISSWYYALANLILAVVIYKYIEYKGAEKEWGDGIRGMAMSLARFSLLKVQQSVPHTKNWRPQLLILCKMEQIHSAKKMAALAAQLKAGKGLTIVASVLEGPLQTRADDAVEAKKTLQEIIDMSGVKGFKDVVVSQQITAGISHLIQTSGLGGLKPNTVMVGWPSQWHLGDQNIKYKTFIDTVETIEAAGKSLIVTKGIEFFPDVSNKEKGTIDVWWTVHGGLLLLLPYLLRKHKCWKNCKLRILTLAYSEDNSIQMERDLKTFMYQLRIDAEVKIIEMTATEITKDTYEKTLQMEQRMKMIKMIRKNSISQMDRDRIRKFSRADVRPDVPTSIRRKASLYDVDKDRKQNLTFTPSTMGSAMSFRDLAQGVNKNLTHPEPEKQNVLRMHTAVQLNVAIMEHSSDAKLVIINLPPPPKRDKDELYYMEFLEVMTEGLRRVLLVRGSESEVITIYS